MTLIKVPLSSEHLTLYVDDDQGIVFNQFHHSLYHLNALSIALLLTYEQGCSKTQTISKIVTETGLSTKQISECFEQLLTVISAKPQDDNYLAGRYSELSKPVPIVIESEHQLTVEVASTVFLITSSSAAFFNELNRLLKPCCVNRNQPDVVLSIAQSDDCYQLFANSLLVEDDLLFEHLMPVVIDRLQILAFQRSDYLFCFHGAALRQEECTLLLPGKSGVGKSTLTAELAAQNYQVFSDEMIAVNNQFHLVSLPLPIAVKSGSWSMLSKHYSELEHQVEWQRIDGRKLKYLWPEFVEHTSDTHSCLLVNPNFTSSQKANAVKTELSVIDTLAILTQGGYQIGAELSLKHLEQLIEFLNNTPCVQLQYHSSKQAILQLELLWTK